MKIALVFVSLVAAVWAYPQAKIDWEDFPMRRMFIDPEVLNDPRFHPGARIINGTEVAPNSIPSQVWIIFRVVQGGSGWTCGGSLITPRYVLTAAHCVAGARLAEVYLGAHNVAVEEPRRVIHVAYRFVQHPDYSSSTITNDVGLIDLETEFQRSDVIDVVKLPGRRDIDNLFEAANVRVSGWGLTVGGGSRSNVLLAVNSSVLSNFECRAVFSIFQESEICISGEGGVGACNGDSGGPLVSGDTQIGIVSYGRTGCPSGYPSAFARVTSFLAWIEANSDYVIVD